MEQIAPLLPILGIAVVFWLLLVRPASRRQKEVARMQAGLVPGDRVMLASGIFATLRTVEDDKVTAQIADGVVVEVARAAISVVERPESPDGADGPGGADGAAGSAGDPA